MARKNLSPTKKELAQFKAMNDLGLTPNAIAVRANRDPWRIRCKAAPYSGGSQHLIPD